MKISLLIVVTGVVIAAALSIGPDVSGANTSVGGSFYLQADARWGDEIIGGSEEKIAKRGSLICTVTMALEYCGINIDPGRLNALLKANSGYTTQGWVKWFSIAKVTGDKIIIELPKKADDSIIDSTLSLGYPVVAKVMINDNQSHWVLIVSKQGKEYLIKDPLGSGKKLDKLSKYNSKVHSVRIFKSKTSKTGILPKPKPLLQKQKSSDLSSQERRDNAFADHIKNSCPTITVHSRINNLSWTKASAISPSKGEKVYLKVDEIAEANIRWYQIIPDITQIYNNANLPWQENAYKWKGFDKIVYHRRELTQFRDKWLIEPFDQKYKTKSNRTKRLPISPAQKVTKSHYYHDDVGSFWFQAEVFSGGKIFRSAGLDESDHRGIPNQTFRVSIRDGQGYIGYLTSFFNVPGLFGSVTYQSSNYIGADCADVLMAARSVWKKAPLEKNYNVAMLVNKLEKIDEIDVSNGIPSKRLVWQKDIQAGDFLAVRYAGSRQYAHIGALYSDSNKNKIFDSADIIIHAGPYPLHFTQLKNGNFDGHIVILRP
jgi:hypothetical protein